MKAKFFTLVVLVLGGFVAAADLNESGVAGNWSGKGTYILDGVLSQCSVMEMQYYADETQFVFVGGQRICDNHEEQFYQVALTYEDGKLYFGDQEVGTYGGGVINVGFTQPEPNGDIRHWRMTIRVQGDHLMYEESRRMNDETTPLISFAGMMQRL
ncbi:MAG: hypothetical protein HRT45_13905 [Bdellovibrionales bacterium]|nr:hypothetical protein [Bdellovibrionales bacterium]